MDEWMKGLQEEVRIGKSKYTWLYIELTVLQDHLLFVKWTIIAYIFKTFFYTSFNCDTHLTAINNSNKLEMKVKLYTRESPETPWEFFNPFLSIWS